MTVPTEWVNGMVLAVLRDGKWRDVNQLFEAIEPADLTRTLELTDIETAADALVAERLIEKHERRAAFLAESPGIQPEWVFAITRKGTRRATPTRPPDKS